MTTAAASPAHPTWIRFGALPRTAAADEWTSYEDLNLRSRNHVTGNLEAGVSVYPGWVEGTKVYVDLSGINAASALFVLDPTCVYVVTAPQVSITQYWCQLDEDAPRPAAPPTGADGEPLVWVHYDDRAAARKVRCTQLWVKLTEGGEWIRRA